MAIWCWAILLPIPREPECTSTHTKPSESSLTSAKWLPDPRSLSEKQCSKRYASLVECKDANYSTTKSRLL